MSHTYAPPAPPSPGATSLRAVWPALLGLSLVFLTEMLDNTVLNVALPTIARDLDARPSDLQWITGIYPMVFGGLMLVFGSLADRFGRRRVMLVGLALFGLASLSVTVVQTPGELIAVRAAIGVAAAMTAPGAMAMSFRLFTDDDLRVRASTLISTVGMAGFAVGPVLSGLVLGLVSWRYLLLVNVPIALVALLAVRFGIPGDDAEGLNHDRIDLPGALLGTTGVVLAIWAPTLGVQYGWTSWTTLTTAAVAVASLVAFVVVERTVAHPMLDLALLRRGPVASGLLNQIALAVALGAVGFTVTLHLQLAWGWTPFEAALGGLPQVVTMLAIAPVISTFVKKLGLRRAGLVAGGVVVAAVLIYALLGRFGYGWIALYMVLAAASLRVIMICATISVMKGLPPNRTSIAAALSDTSQEIGSGVGVAIGGTILAALVAAPITSTSWGPDVIARFEDAVTTSGVVVAAVAAALLIWGAVLTRGVTFGPPKPAPTEDAEDIDDAEDAEAGPVESAPRHAAPEPAGVR